jgi:hypothetical protein
MSGTCGGLYDDETLSVLFICWGGPLGDLGLQMSGICGVCSSGAMARVCTVRLSISLGQLNEVSITQKGVGRKQNGWVGKGAGWMGEVGGKVNG